MKKLFIPLLTLTIVLYACNTIRPIILSADASMFAEEDHAVLVYNDNDFLRTKSLYFYPAQNITLNEKGPIYINQGIFSYINKFYPGDVVQVSKIKMEKSITT